MLMAYRTDPIGMLATFFFCFIIFGFRRCLRTQLLQFAALDFYLSLPIGGVCSVQQSCACVLVVCLSTKFCIAMAHIFPIYRPLAMSFYFFQFHYFSAAFSLRPEQTCWRHQFAAKPWTMSFEINSSQFNFVIKCAKPDIIDKYPYMACWLSLSFYRTKT